MQQCCWKSVCPNKLAVLTQIEGHDFCAAIDRGLGARRDTAIYRPHNILRVQHHVLHVDEARRRVLSRGAVLDLRIRPWLLACKVGADDDVVRCRAHISRVCQVEIFRVIDSKASRGLGGFVNGLEGRAEDGEVSRTGAESTVEALRVGWALRGEAIGALLCLSHCEKTCEQQRQRAAHLGDGELPRLWLWLLEVSDCDSS